MGPPTEVDWLYYFDTESASNQADLAAGAEFPMVRIPGRIDDTTEQLRHSGTLRFIVPFTLGIPPEAAWKDLYHPQVTPLDACQKLAAEMRKKLAA